MTVRVIAVNTCCAECAVCGRPIQLGKTWCSWVCRNADDTHDTHDFDDFEMGDDDA